MIAYFDFVGGLTGEFFWSPKTGAVLNELAPRVHNSAHWTRGGATRSQFELQIAAALGEPIASPQSVSAAVGLVNLIGSEIGIALDLPMGTERTDYKKGVPRPGRKMGHLLIRSDSARDLEQAIQSWVQKLEGHF